MDSEFRQDLVSGNWILIAPKRGKRTNQFKKVSPRKKSPKKGCDFEHAGEQEGTAVVSSYPSVKKWQMRTILNKFPVVYPLEVPISPQKRGPISIIPGVGHQEVVVTRDHNKNFPDLNPREAALVLQEFQARHKALSKDKDVLYVLFFQNWGPGAGTSLYHPHYQIVAIPVIPPDVAHSLRGSKQYFESHKSCVHCTQIKWERSEKKRVVFENSEAVVFCPFVSRTPIEIRIYPKRHLPFFENTGKAALTGVAKALQATLKKLKTLNDPDYNFFIHTAPVKSKSQYKYYHWHIEILPKTTTRAGFEMGTGIEISVVDPDMAATLLKDA